MAKGVVIVAASGNTAQGPISTPANCAGVVTVGAVDQSDVKAPFSSGMAVALAAPGVAVYTAANPDVNSGSFYSPSSGTSFASPHVAGVAALLWASKYGTSADAVVKRLESTAVHIAGTGSSWTYGRVSALDAVGVATVSVLSVPATCTVTGMVTEAVTKRVLAGATITVGTVTTTSDTHGQFCIAAPAGKATVRVTAEGYTAWSQAITVSAGLPTTLNPGLVGAFATASGKVIDAATLKGIQGATVAVGSFTTVGGVGGVYSLQVPAGT
jgi:subtilisin family serine protease